MDTNKLKAQLAAMQDEINRTAEQYGLGGYLQQMMNGGQLTPPTGTRPMVVPPRPNIYNQGDIQNRGMRPAVIPKKPIISDKRRHDSINQDYIDVSPETFNIFAIDRDGGEVQHLPVMPYGFAEQGMSNRPPQRTIYNYDRNPGIPRESAPAQSQMRSNPNAYMTDTRIPSADELKNMDLNQSTSIVDAMKLMGDDPSFANRKKMAESMGITGYTGTAAQNQELMQKYYASKRPFSDDGNFQAPLPPGREAIAPMQSMSPQPIPTSGMQRPMPESPILGGESIDGEPYSFDESPNDGAMMMDDSAGGTAYPPDTRMRTLDDLGPRENTPATFNVSRTPIDNSAFVAGPPNRPMDPDMITQEMDLPGVTVRGSKKVAPKQPVSTAKPTPAKKPVSTPGKPILNTTNFNSLSSFNKTTQDMIKEIAKRNNGKVFLTDKGTKSTIVGTVKNGKVQLQAFPVLTGEYDKPGMYPNANAYSKLEGTNDKTLRYTPTGAFALDEYKNIYGKPGFGLRGTDDAYHVTYPGEYAKRTPKYTDANINNNNMSWGCINGRCGDIATLTKMFNTGDSSYIIDTRLPYNQNVKMINTNKHKKIKEMGGMNSDQSDMYYAGGEIENDPHIMSLYGFENGGEIMEIPVAPYGYAEMGMMMGDDVTGKAKPTGAPTTPKMMTSQQLAGLATQFFSRDPSMQSPLPNFVGSYQLSDMDKTLMMEAMKQMKGGQGSSGAYPVITPQMIDQIRPRIEQNRLSDQPRGQRMGGMNYEDGGQMPMDVAVSRFKAAGKDKGLSGGELQVYVEKMKSKYNYQKGGVVKEQELGNYEVGMYGSGGIMYNGTKFPGYNKAINTTPGDKFKKQMLLEKGGKIKLVKFGHR